MKKIVFIILAMFLSGWVLGQGTTVSNQGKGAIGVTVGSKDLGCIYPNTVNKFDLIPCDKEVTIDFTYIKRSEVKHLPVVKQAGLCEIILKKNAEGDYYVDNTTADNSRMGLGDKAPNSTLTGENVSDIGMNNKSNKIVFFEDKEFAGLCLNPTKSSGYTRKIKQGPWQCSVIYANSTDQKTLYKEAITRLIPKGTEEITIKDDDFSTSYAPTGEVKRRARAMLYINNQSGFVLTPVSGLCGSLSDNISRGKSSYPLRMKDLDTRAYVFELFNSQGHKHRVTVTVVVQAGARTITINSNVANGDSEVVGE